MSAKSTKGEITRQNIIQKTASLMQAQGYHATGLNQIIKESGAPKGSLYFHFPGGKEEIAATAILTSGQALTEMMRKTFQNYSNFFEALAVLLLYLKKELLDSNFSKGCPIATVTLEAAFASARIQQSSQKIYEEWLGMLVQQLLKLGLEPDDTEKRAIWLLSSLEGALILCKAQQSLTALDQVQEMAEFLLKK